MKAQAGERIFPVFSYLSLSPYLICTDFLLYLFYFIENNPKLIHKKRHSLLRVQQIYNTFPAFSWSHLGGWLKRLQNTHILHTGVWVPIGLPVMTNSSKESEKYKQQELQKFLLRQKNKLLMKHIVLIIKSESLEQQNNIFPQYVRFANYLIFLNYTLHSVLFCVSFRCTAQQLDNHILCKCPPSPPCFQYLPGTMPINFE